MKVAVKRLHNEDYIEINKTEIKNIILEDIRKNGILRFIIKDLIENDYEVRKAIKGI